MEGHPAIPSHTWEISRRRGVVFLAVAPPHRAPMDSRSRVATYSTPLRGRGASQQVPRRDAGRDYDGSRNPNTPSGPRIPLAADDHLTTLLSQWQ